LQSKEDAAPASCLPTSAFIAVGADGWVAHAATVRSTTPSLVPVVIWSAILHVERKRASILFSK